MGKPFKISGDAAPRPDPKRVLAPSTTEVADHARKDGDDVQQAAREIGSPDYATSSATPTEAGQANGQGHKQLPTWSTEKPWPAPDNGRKPMKLG